VADMTILTSVASSLKAAGEITKAMMSLRDISLIQGKVIELQSLILAAQSDALTAQESQFSLLDRVRELEDRHSILAAWDQEKEKYELEQIAPNVFVWKLKSGPQGLGVSHKVCPTCFQRKQVSILQQETMHPGRAVVLVCKECGSDFYIHGQRQPEHSTRTPPRRR